MKGNYFSRVSNLSSGLIPCFFNLSDLFSRRKKYRGAPCFWYTASGVVLPRSMPSEMPFVEGSEAVKEKLAGSRAPVCSGNSSRMSLSERKIGRRIN